MKNFFLSLIVLSGHSFAEEAPKTTPIDISHLMKKPADLPNQGKPVSVSCVDTNGATYKKGEKGYEDCVSKMQSQVANGVANPNSKVKTGQPSSNMTLQFGK